MSVSNHKYLFELGPSDFFNELKKIKISDFEEIKEIEFGKKNAIKKLFYCLSREISKFQFKELKKIIDTNLPRLISENRIPQFEFFWNKFQMQYEELIPKEMNKFIISKIRFFSLLIDGDNISFQDLSQLLATAPNSIYYFNFAKPILRRYLVEVSQRYEKAKMPLDNLIRPNILLSCYGIFLDTALDLNYIKFAKELNFYSKNFCTYSAICSYLGESPKKINFEEKPIQKERVRKIFQNNIELNFINYSLFRKDRIYIESEENIENLISIDILNKDFDNALDKIYKALKSGSIKDESFTFLLEVLFNDGNLVGAKKLIEILHLRPGYLDDPLFLVIILKKLLVKNKDFKNARSVAKMFQGISE